MRGFLITALVAGLGGLIVAVQTLIWLAVQERAYRRRRAQRAEDEHVAGIRDYHRSEAAKRALRTPTGEMPELAGRTSARPIMPPRLPVSLAAWPARQCADWTPPQRWMAWTPAWTQPRLEVTRG